VSDAADARRSSSPPSAVRRRPAAGQGQLAPVVARRRRRTQVSGAAAAARAARPATSHLPLCRRAGRRPGRLLSGHRRLIPPPTTKIVLFYRFRSQACLYGKGVKECGVSRRCRSRLRSVVGGPAARIKHLRRIPVRVPPRYAEDSVHSDRQLVL